MKFSKLRKLFRLFVVVTTMTVVAESNDVNIVPRPSKVEISEGLLAINATTFVKQTSDVDATKAGLFLVKTFKQDTGHNLLVKDSSDSANSIKFVKNEAYSEESYRLTIADSSITFEASSYAGFLYGIQSFRQLVLYANPDLQGNSSPGLGADAKIMVQKVTITDTPRYTWRGFMLDSARNFQSVESIKRYLDYLSFIKINRFHWHLVDSQGWRIEIKQYPELIEKAAWRGEGEDREGGYYTQEELREVVKYAKDLNIIIIPEIEMPAHCDCVLYTYPKLACHEEVVKDTDVIHIKHFLKKDSKNIGYFTEEQIKKGKTERVSRNYCAGKEEVFEFLQNVIGEVIEIFDGPYVHVGGDERVGNRWPLCPHCQARKKANNLKDDDALQKYFMERIVNYITSKGRRTIMWAENPQHGIPDDVIVQAWRGKEAEIATAAGHDVINSINPYRYLDYFEYEHQKGTWWLPKMSMQRAYDYQSYPEKQRTDLGKIIGTEAPLWTSWVDERDVEEFMFPRLLAVAEDGWYTGSETSKDFNEFKSRVEKFEPVFATLGARYAKSLSEVPITLAQPATVTTSIKHWKTFVPEFAFDKSVYHYFWSAKPPVKGDHFTITLKEAISATRVRVYSGATNQAKFTLKDAILEVSEDGVNFEKIGDLNGDRRVKVKLAGTKKVKAVRVTILKDQAGPIGKHDKFNGTTMIRRIVIDQ